MMIMPLANFRPLVVDSLTGNPRKQVRNLGQAVNSKFPQLGIFPRCAEGRDWFRHLDLVVAVVTASE